MGILNGFSEMGRGVAQFAGAAGLELQRGELAKQQAILADQLATTRETALQKSSQAFQSTERGLDRSAHSADIATTEAGADKRNERTVGATIATNAATIAGEDRRSAANRAGLMDLERLRQADLSPVAKILRDAGLDMNGNPIGGSSSASPPASAPSTPVPGGQGLEIDPSTGNVGTPNAGGLGKAPGATTAPARGSIVSDLIDKALGREPPPSGYRRSSDGKLEFIPGGPADPAGDALKSKKQNFEQENTLRDEFQKLTSDFRVVQTSYENIRSAAKANDGAGDMSMLYSYVKLLDPGSVVRESEFATAAASGSFGERVQGAVARVLSGARMPESLRQSFVRESKNLYETQLKSHNRTADQYESLAKKNGLEPGRVVTRFERPQDEAAEPGSRPPLSSFDR